MTVINKAVILLKIKCEGFTKISTAWCKWCLDDAKKKKTGHRGRLKKRA